MAMIESRIVIPALAFLLASTGGDPSRPIGGACHAAGLGADDARRGGDQGPDDRGKPEADGPGRVPPPAIARPGELDEGSLSGAYRFYLGTTHSHSGYSGDHAKAVANRFNDGVADYGRHTPLEVFEKAKAEGLDFCFMTDHSSPEQDEFYRNGFTDEHWAATRAQAERASTARFVALRGYEFSRNVDREKGGLGHMNVLNGSAWYSAYAEGHTFAWLYDRLASQSDELVLAQFNHPAMPGIARAKNFDDYRGRTKARNEVVRLAEIWNSDDKMAYVPVVRKIWALGWKVAPTAGTDVHGPLGVEKRRIRTGVLADRLTPEAIMGALKARRVYASLEPRLHLEFTLNGFAMGSELESRPGGDLKARIFVNDPAGGVISKVEVYGADYDANGGATLTVASLPVGAGVKIVGGDVPGGHDFYYVAAFKEGVETARAFTAPIWMDSK